MNGNPGPSASGTTHLDVTVVEADVVKCTLTNKRKARITLTKQLVPASDPGRFDLKLRSGRRHGGQDERRRQRLRLGSGRAGNLDGAGERRLGNKSVRLREARSPAPATATPVRAGTGSSLQLTLSPADVLVCTITNQRK